MRLIYLMILLTFLEQEKHYLSKEYKLLKANKIDTAEFDGFEKDKTQGDNFDEAIKIRKKNYTRKF